MCIVAELLLFFYAIVKENKNNTHHLLPATTNSSFIYLLLYTAAAFRMLQNMEGVSYYSEDNTDDTQQHLDLFTACCRLAIYIIKWEVHAYGEFFFFNDQQLLPEVLDVMVRMMM